MNKFIPYLRLQLKLQRMEKKKQDKPWNKPRFWKEKDFWKILKHGKFGKVYCFRNA